MLVYIQHLIHPVAYYAKRAENINVALPWCWELCAKSIIRKPGQIMEPNISLGFLIILCDSNQL